MDIPADLRLCVSRRAGGLAATTQATPHFSTCEQRINSEDVPLTTSMQRLGVASPSSLFHPKYCDDPSLSLLPLITRYLDRERSGVVGKEHFRELLGQLGQREAEVKELWRASEAAAEYGGTDRKAEASNRPVGVELRTFGRMLSSTRDRTVSGEFVLCLVQYVLMALYTFATRLPFVFLAPEVLARGGTYWDVGVVLGSYQACRALANTVVGLCGDSVGAGAVYPLLVATGMGGYILAACLVDAGLWGMLAFMAVGLSEVVVPLQVALRTETRADAPMMGSPIFGLIMERLRCQYAAVAGASAAAFFVSGWVYHSVGFLAVCYLGAAVQGIQLLLGLTFVTLRKGKQHSSRSAPARLRSLLCQLVAVDVLSEAAGDVHGMTALLERQRHTSTRASALENRELRLALTELYVSLAGSRDKQLSLRALTTTLIQSNPASAQHCAKLMELRRPFWFLDRDCSGSCSEKQFLSFLLPRVQQVLYPADDTQHAPVFGYAYFVIVTQAVMAMCIGTFLATSVLQYQTMGVGVWTTGTLLALGEAFGCLALTTPSSGNDGSKLANTHQPGKREVEVVATLLGRPFHCVPALLASGIATAAFGVPVLMVAVTSQLCLSALNNFTVSLLNEVTASAVRNRADYLRLQSLGQLLRRCGNILTAVTGPILFGIAPWLPWAVYGGVVCLWALLLWAVLWRHARRINTEKGAKGPIGAFRPFALKKPWHVYEVEYVERLGWEGGEDEEEGVTEEEVEEMERERALLWLRNEVNELRLEVESVRRRTAEAESLAKEPCVMEEAAPRAQAVIVRDRSAHSCLPPLLYSFSPPK